MSKFVIECPKCHKYVEASSKLEKNKEYLSKGSLLDLLIITGTVHKLPLATPFVTSVIIFAINLLLYLITNS